MGNCGGRDRVASEDEVEHKPTPVRIVERGGVGTWVPTHAAARILPVDIRQKSQKGISGGGDPPQPKKPGF